MVGTSVAPAAGARMAIVSDQVSRGRILDYRNVGVVVVPIVKIVGDPVPFTNSCLLHLVVGNRRIVTPKRWPTASKFASKSKLLMEAPDVFGTLLL